MKIENETHDDSTEQNERERERKKLKHRQIFKNQRCVNIRFLRFP